MTPSSTLQKATCIAVSVGLIGNSRKVSNSQIEIDADKDLIHVSKTLLDSDELKAIKKRDGEGRRWLYDHTLPSLIFKNGVYRCPNSRLKETEAYLQSWLSERNDLVEDLVAVYPALVKMAKSRLKDVFNPQDYPSVTRLRSFFFLEWKYVTFDTPASLQEISQEFFEQERHKAAIQVELEKDLSIQTLRERTADLVNHLVDRLSGKEDGKPKIFRNSLITNVQDFIKIFHDLNIGNDGKLAKEITKAEKLVSGIDAEALRTNDGLRDSVKLGFEKIKAELDTMITDKPKRAIFFDEDSPSGDSVPAAAQATA